jgi:uncharacterized protein YodC (DUF2158 family)
MGWILELLADIFPFKELLRPKSQFRIGDTVELKDNTGYQMVVREIHKSTAKNDPLIYCQWYDRETKSTRWNLFYESQLKMLDWNERR